MKRRLFFSIILCALCVSFSMRADGSMKKLLSDPSDTVSTVFMGIDLNGRLDMIDYFEAGLDHLTLMDGFRSTGRISKLEDRHVQFTADEPVIVDAYLLTPGRDSLVVFVVTAPVGGGDAIVETRDVKTGKTLGNLDPDYSDWLKKDATKEVSEATLLSNIPFITASAEVDTQNNIITLTNTSIQVPGLPESVTSCFVPVLTYKWNGKSFVKSK